MKNRKILIAIMTILAVMLLYGYDFYEYNKISPLIKIDEMVSYTTTYAEGYMDETPTIIEVDETATLVTVNNRDYIVDNEKLFGILSKYEYKRSRNRYFPYQSDSIIVELTVIQKKQHKHLLLGAFNVWYESGDKEVYDITEGEKLLDEMVTMVSNIDEVKR